MSNSPLATYTRITKNKTSPRNHAIDTISMLPYIMPGSVIAIALVIGFGKKPLVLRHGQYGNFYGCSGYPKCRYTEK